MSFRYIFWVGVLIASCILMFRKPLIGVCANILFSLVNPAAWGLGLEALRFQFVASICLLIAYLLHLGSMAKPLSSDLRPVRILILFALWTLLTCVWAAGSRSVAFQMGIDCTKCVLFVWLITRIVSTEKDLRTVMWTIFGCLTTNAVLVRWGVGYSTGSMSAGFTDTWMAFVVIVVGLLVLHTKNWKERIAGAFMILFLLDGIVFMHRRSAFACLALGGLLLPIGAPKGMRLKVMAGLVLGATLFVTVLTPPEYWGWVETIGKPEEEASAAGRFVLNEASWAMSRDYPMGVGIGNYKYVSMPYIKMPGHDQRETGKVAHNTFLVILVERGWVGLVLWSSMFLLLWLRLFRISRAGKGKGGFTTVMARGMCIGMLAILPGLYTHQDDHTDLMYWLLGLGVVIAGLHRKAMAEGATSPGEEEAGSEAPLATDTLIPVRA